MEDDDDDSDEYEEVDMFANVGKINEDNPSARYAISGFCFETWDDFYAYLFSFTFHAILDGYALEWRKKGNTTVRR